MKSGIFFVTSRHKKATFNLDVAFLFYSFTCYQCGPFCGIIKPRKELSLCPKLSQFVIWKIPMRFRSAATKRRNPSLWQKAVMGYGYHEYKGSSDVVRGVFIYIVSCIFLGTLLIISTIIITAEFKLKQNGCLPPHSKKHPWWILNYSIFTRVQKTGYISVRDGSFAFIGLLFL